MSAHSAIQTFDLSKRYRIGRAVGQTFREAVMGVATAPLRAVRGNGGRPRGVQEFWALQDVNLRIEPGELVGIVGRNGAGKSTLLKILSRITEPTTGHAEIRGRVGSLLEVGTGFHSELTGRENIFLYGAILGMRRAEIARRFDEIVAFAEVDEFLDTPVKRYSSGMYVRLAFAVAAHLEPEILLVDEVLAVGDAVFQARCLGKMSDVTREGRTVLFVSHNMAALQRLCRRGILLDEGRVVAEGGIGEIVTRYLSQVQETEGIHQYPADPGKKIQIREVRIMDDSGAPRGHLDRSRPFAIGIEYEVREKDEGSHIGFMLDRADGTPVCHSADIDLSPEGFIVRAPGRYRAEIPFPGGLLNAGLYRVRFAAARYGGHVHDYSDGFVFYLQDRGTGAAVGSGGRQRPGVLAPALDWQTDRLGEVSA